MSQILTRRPGTILDGCIGGGKWEIPGKWIGVVLPDAEGSQPANHDRGLFWPGGLLLSILAEGHRQES